MLLPQWAVGLAIAAGAGVNAALALSVVKKSLLTKGGAAWAFIIGLGLWTVDLVFFMALLFFFLSSSALTRLGSKREKKQAVKDMFDKGGTRDGHQVLANGLPALIFSILHLFTLILFPGALPVPFLSPFHAGAIGALAAANADTWATELGVLSRRDPRWIADLRKTVPRGTSGGVSLAGGVASLVASAAIVALSTGVDAVRSLPWISAAPAIVLCIHFTVPFLAGHAGSVIDSLLGATVQGFYTCGSCGKGTEKTMHCGRPAALARGHARVNNDLVNVVASTLAGAIAVLVVLMLYLVLP